eukprot:jgi/Galph1/5276/GphlegSOOS_G3978.1
MSGMGQEPSSKVTIRQFVTRKRDFRARAHSNPLNDAEFLVPNNPSDFDWSSIIPQLTNSANQCINFVDLGCGYGGLLCELATVFPDKLMLGMEIRDRVAEYCSQKVEELRKLHVGQYNNIGFVRTNCMKYLPFYFQKGSIEKFFICFPDPHFKRKKHRQRLVSLRFLSEAAYCLKDNGLIYVVTDVEELFEWMMHKLRQHPSFERVSSTETYSMPTFYGPFVTLYCKQSDPLIPFLLYQTDEAQRMNRRGQDTKHLAVFLKKSSH